MQHVTSSKIDTTDRSVPDNHVDNHFNDLHFETWEIFFKSKRLFCLTYVNRTGTSDFWTNWLAALWEGVAASTDNWILVGRSILYE